MSEPTPAASTTAAPASGPVAATAAAESDTSQAGFTTFSGVFRPVLLTILGAMLYLREGWLVGNNGLLGAIAVILAAYAITGTTSLSMASIATNVRVRPGGAFAIIAQALGLEAGGAIGIPLYIAQAASSAMYLYAFSEAWGYLFPSHDPRLVVSVAFLLVAGLAWRSAGLAFRAQGVMLFVVAAALLSGFGGLFVAERVHAPVVVGRFPEASLLQSFAIFFPAATGIMVGAGMSGALADPRRSIPQGTLWAWGVTLAAYLCGAVYYALVASPEELLVRKTVMVDRALFGPLVLIGIVSSTLMAALSSLVAAPQLLQAMAEHRVVPLHGWLSRRSDDGEPRNAVLATLGIGALGLLSGSLDAIAPIITSFFILTYFGVNTVVLLEQRLAMLSFRPTFSVHPTVPVLGVVLCAAGLILSSPRGGVLEFALVIGIYGALMIRRLDTPWETVRSGIPVTVAAWAARRASQLERSERAWKPDLLVPVSRPTELEVLRPLIEAVTWRTGSVKLVGIGRNDGLPSAIDRHGRELRAGGLHTTWSHLHATGYGPTVRIALDLMQTDVFPPNLVVVDGSRHSAGDVQDIATWCHEQGVGMLLVLPDPDQVLNPGGEVDVWVSDRSPDWGLRIHLANLDLQVLVGWLLATSMGMRLRLVTVLRDGDVRDRAERFLDDLIEMGRLPETTRSTVIEGHFVDVLEQAPPAGVHLFGMPLIVDLEQLAAIRERVGGTALFVLDSGQESALA